MALILVGLDGSDTSTRAFELGVQWARNHGDTVIAAHVIPWSPFSFNTPSDNEERHIRREAEIAAATEQVIEPMLEIAKRAGVDVEVSLTHGNPAEALVELAEERAVMHIIVGRTGDSMIKQVVFGSIANRLAQAAPVPVTVVP